MTTTQRSLYRTLINLHPADFRNRFGQEMLLDFEDATGTHSALKLYLDAVLSLLRQWSAYLVPSAPLPQTAHASLLSGQYVQISQPLPSPFELFRAACIAILPFLSIGFTTSHRLGTAQIANVGLRSTQSPVTHSPAARPACCIPRFQTAGTTFASSAPIVKSVWDDPKAERTYEFNLLPATIYAVFLCIYFKLRNYLRKRRALHRGLLIGALALAITAPMHPQILHAMAPLPSFEVASVRPWKRPPHPRRHPLLAHHLL